VIKKIIVMMLMTGSAVMSQAALAQSYTAELKWTIPTENSDGSALDINDIERYTIYDACAKTVHYVDDPNDTGITVEFFPPTCHYRMLTVLKNGIESEASDYATATIETYIDPVVPKPPGSITVTITVSVPDPQ